MTKIAIIGAGFSGLILAHQLKNHADVSLFEKARGVGGRMATRYHDTYEFDHGLPFFQVQSPEFLTFLKPYIASGVVQEWPARCTTLNGTSPHPIPRLQNTYIACPRMNALCKTLATNLDVHLNHQVNDISALHAQGFEWIISTAPYPQTQALLSKIPTRNIKMHPCFTLMLGLTETPAFPWDIARVEHSFIEKICINSQKPQRHHDLSLCIFTHSKWAEEHLEAPEEWVTQQILSEVQRLLPSLPNHLHIALHRWRYATATPTSSKNIWLDTQQKLAACGDWSCGSTLEDAYQAASLLSSKIRHLKK